MLFTVAQPVMSENMHRADILKNITQSNAFGFLSPHVNSVTGENVMLLPLPVKKFASQTRFFNAEGCGFIESHNDILVSCFVKIG